MKIETESEKVKIMKYFYSRFFLGVFALMLFLNLSCNDKTQDEIESIIQSQRQLREVDQLCKDLPKPSDFKFVGKRLGGNTNTASVAYIFKKNSQNNEIINYYENWSKNNGWDFEDSRFLQMTKGNQKIILEFFAGGGWNFVTHCQEPY